MHLSGVGKVVNMNIQDALIKFGLSHKEADLYLAGLELGASTVQDLVVRSGLMRSTVYGVLDRLHRSGLVKSHMRGKKRYFTMADPNTLLESARQKYTSIESVYEKLAQMQGASDRPHVEVFRGISGIRSVYEDVLSKQGAHIEVLSVSEPDTRLKNFWEDEYIKLRVEKKIYVRVIAPDIAKYRKLRQDDMRQLRTTKLMSCEIYPFQNELFVYQKKVAFITHDGDKSLGVIVEDVRIHRSILMMLEYIWRTI